MTSFCRHQVIGRFDHLPKTTQPVSSGAGIQPWVFQLESPCPFKQVANRGRGQLPSSNTSGGCREIPVWSGGPEGSVFVSDEITVRRERPGQGGSWSWGAKTARIRLGHSSVVTVLRAWT